MIEAKSLTLEKTVIVGIINSKQDAVQSKEYLDELAFLTHTAGGQVLQRFVQKMQIPNPKTFIGSGKMAEVENYVSENEVTTVVFDDELTPAQQGNIEKILRCKILDRTGLILDIFAQRAQTSYARTQVELAQYEYLLPRLKGLWTHLERQRGGIGMRGPRIRWSLAWGHGKCSSLTVGGASPPGGRAGRAGGRCRGPRSAAASRYAS